MAQVIIFQNSNGGVSTCHPSEGYDINKVLVNDCPAGAVIVDEETLPMADADFFNAWVMNGSTVTVDFVKAKALWLEHYNQQATIVARTRSTNTAIGLENTPDDATWLASINAGRANIAEATTTDALRSITVGV
jgi:hypothetical protein